MNMSGQSFPMRRYAQSPEAPEERQDASSPEQQAQPGSERTMQPATAVQPVLETAAQEQRLAASSAATWRVPAHEVHDARDRLPAEHKLLPCHRVRGPC